MLRKTSTLVVASLLVASAAFAGVGAAQVFDDGPTLEQASGGADGLPEWVVETTDGDVSAVESWANESDQRTLLRADNDSDTAVVRATATAVGAEPSIASLLDGTLADESYVQSVQPNWVHQRAEPVALRNESEVAEPELGTAASLRNRDAEYGTDGIAFDEDSQPTRLDEVRTAVGQDNVAGTGQGVTVAVVDTGINTANGRVFGNGTSGSSLRVSSNSKNIITNETGVDAIADSGTGHGTFVASEVAANASGTTNDGMAPDADILGVRALNDDGEGSTADIAEGVRHSADQGADVIVMSLGSPLHDPAISSAIEYATEQKNVSAVVVAAGNSRQTVRWVGAPASDPQNNAIAVAASNTTDSGNASVAYFSQLGPHPGTTDNSRLQTEGQTIDTTAPGMEITVRSPTSSGTVIDDTKSGTSMAAPVVGGGIAAVLEERPGLEGNHTQIREEVRASSRPIPNAAAAEAGSGMYASDNLNESVDPFSQEQRMDATAEARDEFWRALSDSSGGFLARLVGVAA